MQPNNVLIAKLRKIYHNLSDFWIDNLRGAKPSFYSIGFSPLWENQNLGLLLPIKKITKLHMVGSWLYVVYVYIVCVYCMDIVYGYIIWVYCWYLTLCCIWVYRWYLTPYFEWVYCISKLLVPDSMLCIGILSGYIVWVYC